MESKYKILFFLVLGILIGMLIAGSTYLIISNNKSKEEPAVDTRVETSNQEEIITSNEILDDKEEIKSNSEVSVINKSIDNEKKTGNIVTSNKINKTTTSNINGNDSNTITSKDKVVINYLEGKSNEISSNISDGTYKEKAKAIFVEVVDFLFYKMVNLELFSIKCILF